MLTKIIEKFSELSSSIEQHDRDKYCGTYQWRSRNKSWLFDIHLDNECSWNLREPSDSPDYELFIDESDLDSLVNKRIDPLGALNSGKLLVGFSLESEKDENKSHVQRFLNVILNRGTVDEDIKQALLRLNPHANEVAACPITESADEVARYIEIGSPCVLRASECKQWKLFRMAAVKIVSKVGEDFEITLLTAEHNPEKRVAAGYLTSTLAEYVKLLYQNRGGEVLDYMAANSVPESLYDCFDYPPYFDRGAFNIPRWWIGPKNTGLGLHRDLVDNFLYQIKGSKKVYLFSPSESDYLYPVEFGGNPFYEPSSVNMLLPDLEKHPKFPQAKGIHCELLPGDMLYLPAGWWHCIRNLEVSWSLNFFAVNQKPVVLNKIKS